MRVFISCSGRRSRQVGEFLHNLLPQLPLGVTPWIAGEEIDPGVRWQKDLAQALEGTDFGILCLTPENLDSRWIHFEAGALAKKIEKARVVPLLIGELTADDVPQPLKQFQALPATPDGVLRLLRGIAAVSDGCTVEAHQLEGILRRYQEEVAEGLGVGGPREGEEPASRPDPAADVAALVHSISRRLTRWETEGVPGVSAAGPRRVLASPSTHFEFLAPPLLLEVIPVESPMRVGDTNTLVIDVTNRSDTQATDIVVAVSLPQEFEFVSADGHGCGHEVVDREIRFGVLEELSPAGRFTYRLVFRAVSDGGAEIEVRLTGAPSEGAVLRVPIFVY